MRIAVVSHTSLYWTGPYARHLRDLGHDVRVVSISSDPLEGVDVDYVGHGTPTRRKVLAHLALVPQVRRALRRFAPEVVLAPYLSSNGMVAALAWRGPLVVSAHGGDVLRQAGYLPGGALLHRRMMRFVCGRARRVHAVSNEIVEALVADGVPAEKIECFPVGVDVDWFVPGTGGSTSEAPRVICTRRQEQVYGNEILVDALAEVRRRGVEFEAVLVGGGPQLLERREQVRRLGLEATVSLPGEVTRDDVRRLLQASDIYVSASTSDGASSSLFEAMACGLLPVVSSIPANQGWVVDGSTGLLFDPGDVASLTEALASALQNPGLRQGARDTNRNRIVHDGDLAANMRRMDQLLTGVES